MLLKHIILKLIKMTTLCKCMMKLLICHLGIHLYYVNQEECRNWQFPAEGGNQHPGYHGNLTFAITWAVSTNVIKAVIVVITWQIRYIHVNIMVWRIVVGK